MRPQAIQLISPGIAGHFLASAPRASREEAIGARCKIVLTALLLGLPQHPREPCQRGFQAMSGAFRLACSRMMASALEEAGGRHGLCGSQGCFYWRPD